MNLHEAYRIACQEYNQALSFFNLCEPDQFEEANYRLSAASARVGRLKRELEREMGQPA